VRNVAAPSRPRTTVTVKINDMVFSNEVVDR